MKVIDLQFHRDKIVESKAFAAWRKRFDRPFAAGTRLPDLSAEVLYRLAGLDEEAENGLGELIDGVNLAVCRARKESPMVDLDIQLFLLDQMRFEINQRLGWIDAFPLQQMALWRIVHDFSRARDICRNWRPAVLKAHPCYGESLKLGGRDREAMVRRMLPSALEAFAQWIEICAVT